MRRPSQTRDRLRSGAVLPATCWSGRSGRGVDVDDSHQGELDDARRPTGRRGSSQDETQKACSQYRNAPPKAVADAIMAREKATIVYPPTAS